MQIEDLLDIVDRPAAWGWICRRYLPDGATCPRCGAAITGARALAAFQAGEEKTYCKECDRSFRTRAVTPLVGTEWEPEEFVQLLLLQAAGRNAGAIAAVLGKSARCVRDMLERVALLGPDEPGMGSGSLIAKG